LLFDKPSIIAYGHKNGLAGERGRSLEQVVEYMMDERFFNRAPASEYLAAVRSAAYAGAVKNELISLDYSTLDCELGNCALAAAFEPQELLSVAHVLSARKT